MKKLAAFLTCALILHLVLLPFIATAESFGLDLDSMSKAELEQLVNEARDAIKRNHEVDYSVESDLNSRLKVDIIQKMTELTAQPDYHIFGGWKYSRDWSTLTVSTEAKIDRTWYPVEAVYEETGKSSYQLMYLSVGDKVYVDNRTGDSGSKTDREASHETIEDTQTESEAIEETSNASEAPDAESNHSSGSKRVAERLIALKGDKNDAVKDIQSMLIQLGILSGKADGDFGSKTQTAVLEFQRQYGLDMTGIVMESDLLAMQDAVAAIPTPMPTPTPAPTPEPVKYISISAEKLNKQYQDNEVAADEKYKNKILQVSGKVTSVDKSEHIFTGPTFYVSLDADGFGLFVVRCEFNEEHQKAVSKLKKGKKVVIQGLCTGKSIVDVYLEDCILVG